MERKLLTTLFFGVLMAALDISILGPALPALRDAFQIDARAASWLITSYVLANLVGTPLFAAISDRWGRGQAYRLAVGIFALGSLAVVIAPEFGWLVAARALQGFGAGGIFPVASAAIGDVIPEERRGRALGMIGATFGLAFLVGPIIGAIILHFASWHWIFAINLPLAALVFFMSRRTLPKIPHTAKNTLDWPGIAILSIALCALAAGLGNLHAEKLFASLLSPFCGGFLLLSAILLFVFPKWEARAQAPLIRPGLLGIRPVKVALLLGLGAGLGEVGVMYLPDMAVQAFQITPSAGSFLLVPLVLGLTVGAPLAGRLTDRLGARPICFVGAICQAVALALFALVPPAPWVYQVAGPLLGLGLAALLGGPLRVVLLQAVPVQDRTATQSMLSASHSIGQIGTAALLGAVAASHASGAQGFQLAYLAATGLSVLLIPLALALPRKVASL